ncbi:MAG: hypothetical protein EHM78_19775 [Myxococcaceae bacterium]|nr:MAG: hypothetical protein EHM78_19775 [Myxococcaceae bacterium]
MTVLRHYSGGSRLSRHRHRGAYAAVVVAGGFVEAGDRGRHRLVAGMVAFHAEFEAHRDDFGEPQPWSWTSRSPAVRSCPPESSTPGR